MSNLVTGVVSEIGLILSKAYIITQRLAGKMQSAHTADHEAIRAALLVKAADQVKSNDLMAKQE